MPRRSDALSVFLKETLPSLPDAIDAITMSVVDVSRKRAGVAAHEDRRTRGTSGDVTVERRLEPRFMMKPLPRQLVKNSTCPSR
jgi:hypothetical protein